MRGLTHGDLFAGVGGFSLACERAGMRTLFHVEIDPAAQRVLRRHWPDTLLISDIREAGAHNLPPVDVLTAGFPCQDLRVAGQRAGLSGARSGLFWEVIRIVGEMREATKGQYPTFVILENVPGLLSSGISGANPGGDFGLVLQGLSDLGAAVAYRILDAQFFGVPQRRRRVFVVADFAERDLGERRVTEVLALTESCRRHPAPSRAAGERVAGTFGGGTTGRGWSDDTDRMTVVPTISRCVGTREGLHHNETQDTLIPFDLTQVTSWANRQRMEPGSPAACKHAAGGAHVMSFPWHVGTGTLALTDEQAGTINSSAVLGVMDATSVRRLTPVECERLQGYDDGWTAGESDSARYRLLGNSVAVPCVEWITRRLAAVALS